MPGEMEKEMQERMQDFRISPGPQVWKQVEAALPKERKRRFILWWLLPIGLLLAGGVWYALGNNKNNVSGANELALNNGGPADSVKIIQPAAKPVAGDTTVDARPAPAPVKPKEAVEALKLVPMEKTEQKAVVVLSPGKPKETDKQVAITFEKTKEINAEPLVVTNKTKPTTRARLVPVTKQVNTTKAELVLTGNGQNKQLTLKTTAAKKDNTTLEVQIENTPLQSGNTRPQETGKKSNEQLLVNTVVEKN